MLGSQKSIYLHATWLHCYIDYYLLMTYLNSLYSFVHKISFHKMLTIIFVDEAHNLNLYQRMGSSN